MHWAAMTKPSIQYNATEKDMFRINPEEVDVSMRNWIDLASDKESSYGCGIVPTGSINHGDRDSCLQSTVT